MTGIVANFDAFLTRFNQGNDGLIRHVSVALPSSSALGVFEVELSAQDLSREAEDRWVNLRLRLSACVELRVSHGPRADCRVLSNGIRIAMDGAWLVLDLDPQEDCATTRAATARSLFYAVGKELTFQVLPYSDSLG